MQDLIGLPNNEGLSILKQELFERIKKFSLLNEAGETFFTGENHSIFFDADGVLTVVYIIPVDEHLTEWNYSIRVLSDDDKIITDIALSAPVQWVKNVGGEQVVKISVSGEAGEIVFKKDDYVTTAELEALYVSTIVALTTKVFQLEQKLIRNGVL